MEVKELEEEDVEVKKQEGEDVEVVGAISLICVRLALLCIVFVGVNLTWRCGHLKALMSAGARGAS